MTKIEARCPSSQGGPESTVPQTLTVTKTKVNEISEEKERKWSVSICCTVASIVNLLVGISLSIPSNVILDLTEENGFPPDYRISSFDQSVFAALVPVGALLSAPVSGYIADRCGRKCGMMVSGIPNLIGYLILSYAHYSDRAQTFKILLFAGRFITGLGMGFISSVVSVYVIEVSPIKLRGVFGTMIESAVFVGVTLNYALGSIKNVFYYDISLVAVGIVALFEGLMLWQPDSPRSLLSKGYVAEAERALKWLRGPKSDRNCEEFKEMKQNIIAKRAKKGMWKHIRRKSVFVPFTYLLVVFSIKQFCGVYVITTFAGEIFVDAGVSNPRTTSIYAVGVSNIIGIVFAFLTADRLGRKVLLITSGVLMTIGTVMLGTHFYITRPSLCNEHWSTSNNNTVFASGVGHISQDTTEVCNPHFSPLAISSLVVYNIAFSMGWGPLPWVLISELLPLSVRGTAVGLCTIVTYFSYATVVGFYLEFVELVSLWFAIWTFAIFSLAGSVFVFIFIPETKGKSLEAIEKGFQGSSVRMCCM